jgi:hypothetical protein
MARTSLQSELQAESLRHVTRRHFLRDCSTGLGAMALCDLMHGNAFASNNVQRDPRQPLSIAPTHFHPKAKRVIFMHMAGAPSQLEMFDYKPELAKLDGKDCPSEFLAGKRFAFIDINAGPKMLGPQHSFQQYGESGTWISDRLPHFSQVVDEACIIKSMHTDEFNHAPAQFLLHTGFARLGRPSLGSWVTYGLGSENENLPGFVVLVSGGKTPSSGKSVWGSGFLPSVYQGVQCRTSGDPVLFASDPPGMARAGRRRTLDAINDLNQMRLSEVGDPEILTRINQYEMAFRMQMSVPDAMDISKEPAHVHKLYGSTPGGQSLANNCLLARRLVERGVRFVQLYDWGWDNHGTNEANDIRTGGFTRKCKDVDQPMSALILDLKQRGMLDDTLIVWGSEFGRTPMRENRGGKTMKFIGRDHHKEAYTMWVAGGGFKAGHTHGETDEFGYYATKDRVHVHDLQATLMHQLGFDHERLTYFFQGRDYRLTDIHGHVVRELIS